MVTNSLVLSYSEAHFPFLILTLLCDRLFSLANLLPNPAFQLGVS